MIVRRGPGHAVAVVSIVWLLVGCTAATVAPVPTPNPTVAGPPSTPTPAAALPSPTPTLPAAGSRTDGLSDDEVATLSSLEQVDDYPLYTLHYYGAYVQRASSAEGAGELASAAVRTPGLVTWPSTWACSLFAALGDPDDMLYGRNFDWRYSPAVLLFTDPPDGYASVSMVDIEYLGFEATEFGTLADLPLAERRALLAAPLIPFDGMNERGLTIGMAAVPSPGESHDASGGIPWDPARETVDSVRVIREMLDRASNVDEAVAIFQSHNIDMGSGPTLHYLIADRSGRSVLVEFYRGETVVIPNTVPWHLATNFLRASAGESARGRCSRYDRIDQWLAESEGTLTAQDGLELLSRVSQENTQWSVVYGINSGDVTVAMGREHDSPYVFRLGP